MISFLSELRKRNKILYYFGWLCMVGAILSIVLIQVDNTFITGINAWIKPLKFFLSVGIYSWTMGWLLYYLQYQKKVTSYSWAAVIIMTFELSVIVWQASNGRLSHFNISTPLYTWLFQFMGIAIVTITLWTAYMTFLFFRQKQFSISETYLWGIRLGMIFFIIFSFEGGLMAYKLSHGGKPGWWTWAADFKLEQTVWRSAGVAFFRTSFTSSITNIWLLSGRKKMAAFFIFFFVCVFCSREACTGY